MVRRRRASPDAMAACRWRSDMRRLAFLATMLATAATPLPVLAQAPAQPPASPVYEQRLAPQAVREVQQRLRALGFYTGSIDGIWGRRTQAALARFQEVHRLQVTGQLNPATVTAMGLTPDSLLAGNQGSSRPPAAAQPLAPNVVRTVQERLRRQGFYSGAIDGIWGPNTAAAVEHFQQVRGLQATGQLNPTTITALGLNPNDLMAAGTAPLPSAGSSTPDSGAASLNRQELRRLRH